MVTEQGKDKILNGILLVSVLLFIVGFARPHASSRSETPVHSEYNVLTLQPMSVNEAKQFEELEPVVLPTAPTANVSTPTADNTVPASQSAPQQPTNTPKVPTLKPVPRTVNNYLSNSLRKTLNSVGIRTY